MMIVRQYLCVVLALSVFIIYIELVIKIGQINKSVPIQEYEYSKYYKRESVIVVYIIHKS